MDFANRYTDYFSIHRFILYKNYSIHSTELAIILLHALRKVRHRHILKMIFFSVFITRQSVMTSISYGNCEGMQKIFVAHKS